MIGVLDFWLFSHYYLLTRLFAGMGLPPRTWPACWAVMALLAATPLVVAGRSRTIHRFISLATPILLFAPLTQFAIAYAAELTTVVDESSMPSSAKPGEFDSAPNVYFFVADAFGRQDILDEVVGVDISPLNERLSDAGFQISDLAMANYPTTYMSLASTLQMNLVVTQGEDRRTRNHYTPRLQGRNRVATTFQELGYDYIHSYPAWGSGRCSGVEDLCLGSTATLDDTDWAIIRMTPLTPLFASSTLAKAAAAFSDPRVATRRVLDGDVETPYFVFAHLLNPHPPHFWDAECEPRNVPFDPGTERTIREYADAVTCLVQQLTEAIDTIIDADPTAVIIVQGDHGTSFLRAFEGAPTIRAKRERLAIFSAMRLPPGCEVPDDLTSVNTFRLVFACLSGTPPRLLPNMSYWTTYEDLDVEPLTGKATGRTVMTPPVHRAG